MSGLHIAFLGTGLMGTPMVRQLAAAGHQLHVWNRTARKAQALADVACVHDSCLLAVNNADIVITMLSDGAATLQLLEQQGVLRAAKTQALFINMASVEPACDQQLAQQAKALDKRYMDAPVSGGVTGAEQATLSIFVGAEVQDMQFAESVLALMGKPVLLGSVGAGQTAKLANQLIVAITIGAVAEAFTLAEAAGCDLALLHQALQGGFADSRVLELHGRRMIDGDFKPGGRACLQLKDIDNALFLAEQEPLTLPLAHCAQTGFQQLVDTHQGGEMDHSAYYWWLQQLRKKQHPYSPP